MVMIGLVLLLTAFGVGVSGVLSNNGSDDMLGQDFSVLGLQLAGLTTGQLFLYGMILGVVGMIGLALVLRPSNRWLSARRSRKALQGSQSESEVLREDRDRLTRQLDEEHTERALAESLNATDGEVTKH